MDWSREIWIKNLIRVLKNSRPEYRAISAGKNMHSLLFDIVQNHEPNNWHLITLEYPHIAKDGLSIAYYPNMDKMSRKIATTCKPGKYIKRHFPHLADNVIRDYVAPYLTNAKILDNIDDMVALMRHPNCPQSCMTNDRFSTGIHPYQVYNPEFGWSMAVKYDHNSKPIGRALINNGVYVRAYTSSTSSMTGTSIDCQLESWLDANGYTREYSWPSGTKISNIKNKYGNYIAPYIDGSNDNADIYNGYLKLCSDGELECNNTSGTADEKHTCICADCGNRVDEDYFHYPDDYSEGVCENCLNDNYTWIISRRYCGRWSEGRYIPNSDVIETVEGDDYASDDYAEFDIIKLHDGTYTHMDNAIFDTDSEEHYHVNDNSLELCEDDSEYHSEYWQCATSDNYYSDNCDDYITDDNGDKHHIDHYVDPDQVELF